MKTRMSILEVKKIRRLVSKGTVEFQVVSATRMMKRKRKKIE